MVDELMTTQAKGLVEMFKKKKEPLVQQIIALIEPYFYDSGFVENDGKPFWDVEAKDKKFVRITKMPTPIVIPEELVFGDLALEHCCDADGTITLEFFSKDGILIDDMTFSDYYMHSEPFLIFVLDRIREMYVPRSER